MDILDRIKEAMTLSKRSQKDVCDYLGVSKQTFSEWNAGRNESYKKHLAQIASYLGVSVDYLLGNEGNMYADYSSQTAVTLTPQEAELLTLFRETTEKGRLEMITACVNIQKEIEKNPVTGIEGGKVG